MTGTPSNAALPACLDTPEEQRMYETLASHAPAYAAGFLRHLPRARAVLLGRLVAALWREDVTAIRTAGRRVGTLPLPEGVGPGRWHIHDLDGCTRLALPLRPGPGGDRVTPDGPVLCLRPDEVTVLEHPHQLIELLRARDPASSWASLSTEFADTAANLALAYARSEQRRSVLGQAAVRLDAADAADLAEAIVTGETHEDATVFFERLNTEGHNLHPCGRGRLGMRPADVLCHDLESDTPTELILTGIRRTHADFTPDEQGRDIGRLLRAEYPWLDTAIREHCHAEHLDPAGYLFVPVHAWQLEQVVRPLFADEIAGQVVVPVPAARLTGVPTSSVRTLLTGRSATGRRWLVKVALDVLIGSTRRSISAHTTNNGPVYSRLLGRIIGAEPALAGRIVLLDELAGTSYRPAADEPEPDRRARALSALIRSDISGHLRPGEVPVPSCALLADSPVTDRSVLAELLTRYGAARGEPDPAAAGLRFVAEYAGLLLAVSVTVMTKYGIGLEAHLQNCVFTFVDGAPTRLVLRDWGGVRIYPPRLHRQGLSFDPRPGAVTVTADVHVMHAKVGYTVLANHLSEVIDHLADRCGVDPRAAWQRIRAELDRLLTGLAADPALRGNVLADRDFLLAPTLPLKAFLRMRLDPDGGDRYEPVPNPLHEHGAFPPAAARSLPSRCR